MVVINEDEEVNREEERPQWLEIALVVLPPLSLITALLVYFAAVQRAAFADGLGLNVDFIEEASVLSYLLRSTQSVFFPLAVASLGLLLWLWVDRMLRRWVCSRAHLRAISRASWVLPASAAVLIFGTVLVAMVSPVAAPYVLVVRPFIWALAVLVAAYGPSLRRLVDGDGGRSGSVGRRWAINAMIGLLVSLLLFDGMYNFAQVVGYGRAQRIIDEPQLFTKPVVLYSAQDLQIDQAAAVRQDLPVADHLAYRYRYQGLRLVFVDGGRYFLIGRNWQSGSGAVIVLPREGLRIEFPRISA